MANDSQLRASEIKDVLLKEIDRYEEDLQAEEIGEVNGGIAVEVAFFAQSQIQRSLGSVVIGVAHYQVDLCNAEIFACGDSCCLRDRIVTDGDRISRDWSEGPDELPVLVVGVCN